MLYGFVTVENLMFLGAGFLVAWLTALPVISAVQERAVRLTRRKLEVEPLSMREMQTEKDTLRADFAMTTQALERRIEELKGKYTTDIAALAKKNGAIVTLKETILGRDGFIADLQKREVQMEEHAKTVGAERDAAKSDAAAKAEALSQAQAQVANLSAKVSTLAEQNESLVTLKGTLAGRDGFIADLQNRQLQSEAREQKAAAERDAAKSDAAAKAEALHQAQTRIAGLSAELAALTTALNRRIDMYNVQQHALMTLTAGRDLPDLPSEIVVTTPQRNGNGHAQPAPQPIRLPDIVPLAPIAAAIPFAGDRDAIRRALESVLADGAGVAPM